MEEKNFLWLAKLLAAGKAQLNCLETIFLSGEVVDIWVFTDEVGVVRKRCASEEGVYNCTDALDFLLNRLKSTAVTKLSPSSPVCYSVWKTTRTLIDVTQTEEAVLKRDALTRCSCLQEFKPTRSPRVTSYIYHAVYTNNHGYSTAAFRVVDKHREKETNVRVLHKMRDVLQVVLEAVERVKLMRVMEVELEVMQDETGALWLVACEKCKVAVPAYCRAKKSITLEIPEASRRIKNLLVKKKTKIYEKDDDSTQATLREHKYVFKRGQLRNQHSNLNSPIRIHSPLSSREGSHSDSTSMEPQSPRSTMNTLFSRGNRTERPNPNFQELLLLTYTKRRGNRADDFQRYLDSLLQRESELKSRLSMWNPDGILTSMPSVTLSSESDASSPQLSPKAKYELPLLRPQLPLLEPSASDNKLKVRSQFSSPKSRKFKKMTKGRTQGCFDVKSVRLQSLLTPVLSKRKQTRVIA